MIRLYIKHILRALGKKTIDCSDLRFTFCPPMEEVRPLGPPNAVRALL